MIFKDYFQLSAIVKEEVKDDNWLVYFASKNYEFQRIK